MKKLLLLFFHGWFPVSYTHLSASHNEHGHFRYKAVGRLPETGTPWDNAILIPIESVWAVHDALPDAGHGLPLGHLFEGKGSPLPGVSAVVVKPESIAAAYRPVSYTHLYEKSRLPYMEEWKDVTKEVKKRRGEAD